MEPAPLLADELDEHMGSRAEVTPPMGLDVSADDMEAPYLRLRTSTDDANIATPTPSLVDLTDLVVTVPEIPQQARRKAPHAPQRGDGDGDGAPDLVDVLVELGDAGGGLTAERLTKNRSRISLSRPWLVGLGVLAFAAGLLTAAAARVVATPVRAAVATATATPSAPPSANPTPNPSETPPPTEAPAPVLVAAANVEPPAAEPPIEAHENTAPATAPAIVAAAPAPAPAPKPAVTAASAGKARTKAVGSSSTRGHSRSSSRARLDAKSDGRPEAKSEARSNSRDDTETTVAAPAVPAEAKAAATPHRSANWVDPFAE